MVVESASLPSRSLDLHDFLTKNQCTASLTMTAAGNGTCMITLRLNDKEQASLSLFLRHHPSKNNQNPFNKTKNKRTKNNHGYL